MELVIFVFIEFIYDLPLSIRKSKKGTNIVSSDSVPISS